MLKEATNKPAGLAEEIASYALVLGCAPSSFRTAADKLRRKEQQQLHLLPWTAAEPEIRAVVEPYLQRGTQAREEGKLLLEVSEEVGEGLGVTAAVGSGES